MSDRPSVPPVGFAQLGTLFAVLIVAVLLPARTVAAFSKVTRLDVLDFFAGELILLLAGVGFFLTIVQIAFLHRPDRGTPHYTPAILVAGAGVGVGCVIAVLALYIGFLAELPELKTSPGAGSVGVFILGVLHGAMSVHRLRQVVNQPSASAPQPLATDTPPTNQVGSG